MCNRNLLLLSLIVIGYLKGIRTETNCSSNFVNSMMCDLIDELIDPCEDFYRFACGKYIKKQKQSGAKYRTIGKTRQQRNRLLLIDHFHHHARYPNYIENVLELDLAADLFKSCLDRDTLGVQPLLQLIDDFGGWPVLRGEDWSETNWVGLNISKELLIEAADIASIIKIVYNKNVQSEELPTFVVNTNTLKDNREIYKNLMANTAIKLGAYPPIAERDMEEVISFVMKLVNTNPTLIKSRLTIAEMEFQFPTLLKFLRNFIEPHVKYIIFPSRYYEALELTLTNTSARTIANYLIWRVVVASAPYVERVFELLIATGIHDVNADNELWKLERESNRDLDCFIDVDTLLRVAIDAVFLKEKANLIDEVKGDVIEMTANIRRELIEMVTESVWMDNESKAKAINKLSAIAISFGRRDKNLAREELLDSNLKLQSDNFFQNFRTIKKYYRSHQPYVQVASWDVNGQYSNGPKGVFISPGLLQEPLYSIYFPLYKQYGALGRVVGHELAHAIDPEKHNLDINGYTSNWINSTEQEYKRRANCLKQQFSAMTTENGVKLNGTITNSEDVSDIVGVKAAYRAYLKLTERDEPSLGLWNYTNRQLFWISLAQSRCSYYSKKVYFPFIKKRVHSLSPFRIFGMIKNVRDFSNDFSCPPNSTMYFRKNETCEFW